MGYVVINIFYKRFLFNLVEIVVLLEFEIRDKKSLVFGRKVCVSFWVCSLVVVLGLRVWSGERV